MKQKVKKKQKEKDEMYLSDKKIAKLAKKISKTFSLSEEESLEVIYEEWDIVEALFHTHQKVKIVHEYLVDEINYTYRIA
ncbi:MAG: hypothetical protein Q9M39_09130 [Sulfurovum sp.]|nr:hypothetical protein [Sulfurovum sp.]